LRYILCLTSTRLITRLVTGGDVQEEGEVDPSIPDHAARLLAEVRSGISRISILSNIEQISLDWPADLAA
jgi:hypothetical protein